jgi:hypothetical protein
MTFKQDLNPENALASEDNQIAILFAQTLNSMWNLPKSNGYGCNSFSPHELKRGIGQENELF